jgi:16S rRNA (adenine1518-N6/adenine1519-N6)-dimethyltransferase
MRDASMCDTAHDSARDTARDTVHDATDDRACDVAGHTARDVADDRAPVSWLANPRETRAILKTFGFFTKHRLGQNFLVHDEVIARIVAMAEIDTQDVVLEIGPGIGTLTVALLARAGAVVAVEADRSLQEVLATTCASHAATFALVLGDALKITPAQLNDAVASLESVNLAPDPTLFVANLPYHVAATTILRTFQELLYVRRAVVMVQAEVADRIAATPGTKAYGAYTAKLALYGRVTGRFEVSPGNFMPPPQVQSAVVRIDRLEGDELSRMLGYFPDIVTARHQIAHVIDAAFAQRRKTIRNSMTSYGFDRTALDEALRQAEIDPGCRAETLAVEDFVQLTDVLRHNGVLYDDAPGIS